MSTKNKDLCFTKYNHKGNDYYIVTVQKRNKNGKMIKKKSRFTKTGNRISSIKAAEDVKFWLKKQLEQVACHTSNYTWSSWFAKFIDEMRKSGIKESTLLAYNGLVKNYADPSWEDKDCLLYTSPSPRDS